MQTMCGNESQFAMVSVSSTVVRVAAASAMYHSANNRAGGNTFFNFRMNSRNRISKR